MTLGFTSPQTLVKLQFVIARVQQEQRLGTRFLYFPALAQLRVARLLEILSLVKLPLQSGFTCSQPVHSLSVYGPLVGIHAN